MNENITSILYFLLGAGKAGEKKLKEYIEEIILNSEYTKEEGERLFREFKIEFDREKELKASQFYSLVDDLLIALNMPERDKIRENLEKIVNDFSKKSNKVSSVFKNKNTKLTVVKK